MVTVAMQKATAQALRAGDVIRRLREFVARGETERRIESLAKMVHEVDPHHLVTPGVSVYRTESERRDWLAVCKLPEVDFCDAHVYPEDLLHNRDAALLESAIDDFVQLAHHVAGKPLVLGEFGIHGARTARGAPAARLLDGAHPRAPALRRRGGRHRVALPAANGLDKRHGISVASRRPRRARRRSAKRPRRAHAHDAVNPDLGPHVGEVPLMPLHGEFLGKAPSPKSRAVRPGPRSRGTPTYDRAAWEATGVLRAAPSRTCGHGDGLVRYRTIVAPGRRRRGHGGAGALAPPTRSRLRCAEYQARSPLDGSRPSR
jgi:hypothetical protein